MGGHWVHEGSRRRLLAQRLVIGTCFGLGVVLLCAGGAMAKPMWLQPVDITVSRHPVSDPAIAVNSSGEAAVVWSRQHSLGAALTTGVGSPWHSSNSGAPSAVRPQVAIDANGDVVALWEHWEGESLLLQGAFKPAGQKWGPPVTLSGDIREGQNSWRLLMNPRGDAVLAWTQYEVEDFAGHPFDAYRAFARVMPAASGTWGPVVQLSSSTGYVVSPDVSLDDGGDVLAVWREFDRGNRSVMAASGSASTPSGAWSPPAPISNAGEAIGEEGIRVAMGPTGAAVVAWSRAGGICGPIRASSLIATSRPPAGSWTPPVALSEEGECPVEPQLAVDTHGDALAMWNAVGRRVSTLEVASGSVSTGAWKPSTRVAKIGALAFPLGRCRDLCPGPPLANGRLAMAADGDAVAVWNQSDEGIYAARKSGDSDIWGAPVPLSAAANAFGPPAGGPRLAVAPGGEAIAVWGARDLIQGDALADLPLLPSASLIRSSFKAVARDGHGRGKTNGGTRIRLQLQSSVRLRIAIVRLAPGMRPALDCLPIPAAPVKESYRHCTRREFVAVIADSIRHRGKSSVPFGGLIGNRALKPGTYEAVVQSFRGAKSSSPVALPFTILPQRVP